MAAAAGLMPTAVQRLGERGGAQRGETGGEGGASRPARQRLEQQSVWESSQRLAAAFYNSLGQSERSGLRLPSILVSRIPLIDDEVAACFGDEEGGRAGLGMRVRRVRVELAEALARRRIRDESKWQAAHGRGVPGILLDGLPPPSLCEAARATPHILGACSHV